MTNDFTLHQPLTTLTDPRGWGQLKPVPEMTSTHHDDGIAPEGIEMGR